MSHLHSVQLHDLGPSPKSLCEARRCPQSQISSSRFGGAGELWNTLQWHPLVVQ